MKHIKKNKTNEPKQLQKYRTTTPNAIYKGYTDTEQRLKKALLIEQGHLCAYCMRRISLKRNNNKPKIEVEHYLSQDKNPESDLDYFNMLGVCNGNLFKNEHCDKSKKETLLNTLNPLKPEVEKLITYSNDGSILSVSQNSKIEEDIKLLNLNDENFLKARKRTIDIAMEEMIEKYPLKQWTKMLIKKEIEFWSAKNKKGKYKEFCQIAIWFWKKQMQKNRYPTR